jgi:predicted unusual protein kinase regulating ubiquinone biosynthesis (AarF/ABC1/UbiB family)
VPFKALPNSSASPAAASWAGTSRADADGTVVVVRRPNIREQIAKTTRLSEIAEFWQASETGRPDSTHPYRVSQSLLRELDYRIEAHNLGRGTQLEGLDSIVACSIDDTRRRGC